jgi:hypothetical protein
MPEISAKKLASLLRFGDQTKTKISSISGEYGERIKESAEKDSLHRGAFNVILKLKRADEEKRDEFLRCFDLYRDLCDENELWGETHAGNLADMAEAKPLSEVVKDNVATLKGGIKQLSDEGPSDYAKGERVPAAARRPGPTPQKAGHTFGVSVDPLADSAAE